MSPRKGGPSAGTNTSLLPARVLKREAVELYRSSGKSIPKMAEELGIASESLRRWIRQHEIDAGEREELSRLRRENKTLKQEREFLKKAAVFFAREDGTR